MNYTNIDEIQTKLDKNDKFYQANFRIKHYTNNLNITQNKLKICYIYMTNARKMHNKESLTRQFTWHKLK